MMKKDKNKGKKSFAAVGAVVAAGLTPGIVAATPQCAPVPEPSIELTAAQVVAIDDNTYSFDELYAMQQRDDWKGRPTISHQTSGGSRYGVIRPQQRPVPPQKPVIIVEAVEGLDTIQVGLLEYCTKLLDTDFYTRGVIISLDSDLTREVGMNDRQLKELKAFIEDYYGVEVSYHRFRLNGQLNTLRLISHYIFRIKSVWD
jgi:hypothetical protein